MKIRKDREYVLASNKHRNNNRLQFWGKLTDDNDERCYGGYYTDLDTCERYTKAETKYGSYPILDNTATSNDIFRTEHFYIKVEHLKQIKYVQVKTATTVEWY